MALPINTSVAMAMLLASSSPAHREDLILSELSAGCCVWCGNSLRFAWPIFRSLCLICLVCIIIVFVPPDLYWVCLHGLESRSERRFGTWFKSWLGSWFELRAFTWATNAFPITIRNCALRVIFCSYYAVRARWLTHALMHGFSAHF